MSENKNTPQEIDLIELFKNLWNWFYKWFNTIFFGILYFFIRNAIYFIICIFLAYSVKFFEKKITKKFYKSELIGYSYTISNVEVIQLVNNWDYSNEFGDSVQAKIKNIKGTYLLDKNRDGRWDEIENIDDEIPNDSILNKRLYGNFCIQIQVYDTTLIKEIAPRIMQYMSNNERVKKLNKIRLVQKEEYLDRVKNELKDLDSLKNTQYFKQSYAQNDRNGSLLIWNEKDVKLYHSEIFSLYATIQNIERELHYYYDPFEIVQEFTPPRLATDVSKTNYGMIIKLILIIGFMTILAWDQKKLIRQLIQKAKQNQ
jgi:hypothetical protein